LINPADFYMDVIAGLVPRVGHPEFDYSQDLFTLWEDHMSASGISTDYGNSIAQYSTLAPYQTRTVPGFWSQFLLVWHRYNLQQLRQPIKFSIDVVLTFVAGAAIGMMFKEPAPGDVITICLLSSMSVGFCTGIASLFNFGEERVIYWREAAMGMNRVAYFCGKNVSELPKLLLIMPLAFLCVLYMFTVPRATFMDLFLVMSSSTFACSGVAYLISVAVSPKSSQLALVVFILLSCMVGGSNPTLTTLFEFGSIIEAFCSCSFARWMMEAMYVANVRQWPPIWNDWVDASLSNFGYHKENFVTDLTMLLLIGTMTRIFACVGLYACNRRAQV